MRPAGTDVITNEWFPVARIEPGPPAVLAFPLLGERYLLVTGPGGERLCAVDTCPHRGAQLSRGMFDGVTLDMAHFPFVHRDYPGAPPQTAVRPNRTTSTPEGLHVEDARFHQPRSGPGTSGTDVLYHYSVPAPYAATLTKAPGAATGDDRAAFSILLVAVPLDELVCDVWLLTTVHDADADLVAYDEFNRTIFAQDFPVVESQRPRRLPVQPTEELHQRADKVSLAYCSYLKDRGVRYGTTATGGPEP